MILHLRLLLFKLKRDSLIKKSHFFVIFYSSSVHVIMLSYSMLFINGSVSFKSIPLSSFHVIVVVSSSWVFWYINIFSCDMVVILLFWSIKINESFRVLSLGDVKSLFIWAYSFQFVLVILESCTTIFNSSFLGHIIGFVFIRVSLNGILFVAFSIFSSPGYIICTCFVWYINSLFCLAFIVIIVPIGRDYSRLWENFLVSSAIVIISLFSYSIKSDVSVSVGHSMVVSASVIGFIFTLKSPMVNAFFVWNIKFDSAGGVWSSSSVWFVSDMVVVVLLNVPFMIDSSFLYHL